MLEPIRRISNPIGGLPRLMYTNQEFISLEDLEVHGVRRSTVDLLLERAHERIGDKRLRTVIQPYRNYMDGIHRMDVPDDPIVILDFKNYCHEDSAGRFRKMCVDDFAVESSTAPYLVRMHSRLPEGQRTEMERLLFWRLSLFDVPFRVRDGRIEHASKEATAQLPWGRHTRSSSDTEGRGYYHFSDTVFSWASFKRMLEGSPGALDSYVEAYERMYPGTDEDEFLELARGAAMMNRALLKQKYADLFGGRDVVAYMLQGDDGRKFVDAPVIGEKLLHDTKKMPQRGALEPQALNRLAGWIGARAGSPGVIVRKGETGERPELERPEAHPFSRHVRTLPGLEEAIGDVDGIEELRKDVVKYQFGVDSIEGVLLRLNHENPIVHTDTGYTMWAFERGDETVHSLPIEGISPEEKERQGPSVARPSNVSAPCMFQKFLNILPRDFWPDFDELDSARSGTALHAISNEIEVGEYEELERHGIRAGPRSDYCEVSLRRFYRPSKSDRILAKDEADRRFLGTPLIKYLKELYTEIENTDRIMDSGRLDAAAVMGDVPVIIDFKRRMAVSYPTQYFFKQMARYGMMVMDTLDIVPEHFYTVVVQRPFSANTEDIPDMGVYRDPVFTIRKVGVPSEFLEEVRTDWFLEYASNRLLRRRPGFGWLFREVYGVRATKPACGQCFANTEQQPMCGYFLTGEEKVW